jgi:hypothetical protein
VGANCFIMITLVASGAIHSFLALLKAYILMTSSYGLFIQFYWVEESDNKISGKVDTC